MDYVEFGATGARVSVAGLGCGGHSRLGQTQGASFDHSVAIVQAAIDQGITLIDTAVVYGTEDIVGTALQGRRDQVLISTKAVVRKHGDMDSKFITPAQLRESLEASLKRLKTDYVDVFNLHGVALSEYDYCQSHMMPELLKLREEGKLRFVGITERFGSETAHEMLNLAVEDDFWQVMMIGFNLLNPSARKSLLKRTQAMGVGTLCMFAVRRALSNPAALAELVEGLIASAELDASLVDKEAPLGFLTDPGVASSVTEAAYRFCRHEPGIDVVLTGTGKPAHLSENIGSILQDPLPAETLNRLHQMFGDIDSVSGN